MEGVVGEGKGSAAEVVCVCLSAVNGWFVFLVSFRLVCCRRFPFESKRQHVYCRSAPRSVLAVRLRRPDSRPVPHLPFFRSAAFCLPSGSPVLPPPFCRILCRRGVSTPAASFFSPDQPDPISRREEVAGISLHRESSVRRLWWKGWILVASRADLKRTPVPLGKDLCFRSWVPSTRYYCLV